MSAEVIVIGAGIGGLACAAKLASAGVDVLVLEKSTGIGGRCATRRVDGQPVDHGICFLHGSNRGFLNALRGVRNAMPLEGWPGRVVGGGLPCQPRAFTPTETRMAFEEGLTAFPKWMARGVPIRRNVRATSIQMTGEGFRITTDRGTIDGGGVVVAVPVEQAMDLLRTLEGASRDVEAAKGLLSMIGSVPCLTVLAGYPREVPLPTWDILYPRASRVLQLVSQDSAKRSEPAWTVLVLQARPGWSVDRLDEPSEGWAAELIAAAGASVGGWAAEPAWFQAHRWRFARTDGGGELVRPLLLSADRGRRIGLAGEAFATGGGAEAAWLSGAALAGRWLEEEKP